MNNLSARYRKSRLLIGFISLFSMSFLSRALFESNPQDCEMISVTGRKNKAKRPTDGDNIPLPY